MTRTTEILLRSKKGLRKFENYRAVPVYKQTRDANLKDQVSAKGEGRKVTPCLQEISQMLVCFQRNDYNQAICSKEIETFNKCNATFMAERRAKQAIADKGLIASPGGKLPSKQMNSILKKFPHPTGADV